MSDETPGFLLEPSLLLGLSVHDDRAASYLAFHDAQVPRLVFPRGDAFYGAANSGFALTAATEAGFVSEFGIPVRPLATDADERFVRQIFLSQANCEGPGSGAYPYPLPLGLRFGDPAAEVGRVLGVRPGAKRDPGTTPGFTPVAAVWSYRRGEVTWIIKLDAEHRLAAVYVLPMSASERAALDRKASLKADSRTIDPANVDKVEALRATFPMPRWRETLADDDDLFTERNIAESEALLTAYLDQVKAATARRSAAAIHAATKSLVTGLNKLNRRDAFIETLERDELCVLIDAIIAATGFKVKDGEDITEGWREW